ncbi:hypothetical protein PSQ90_07810 [Devosia rhodophyticola]|uniref:Uncharacterized protein n=1 Tax=Devosia rhodophyticola TaxID=3026423 RepID=A0ABY7Z0Y1_9HYPH|nr:hypothetical protein [Devosia rhodophyticola]WDR07313.1 hypothetical protein PSQ90_07810 [Devosia rhodophyticola]
MTEKTHSTAQNLRQVVIPMKELLDLIDLAVNVRDLAEGCRQLGVLGEEGRAAIDAVGCVAVGYAGDVCERLDKWRKTSCVEGEVLSSTGALS